MKFKRSAAIAILAMAISQTFAATPHTFKVDVSSWETKPRTLAVAGDFNQWNKTATPMTKAATGEVWQATVELPDGVIAYKFVADGERWLNDPKADASLESDDGNGGKNSGVKIGGDKAEPAAPQIISAEKGHLFVLNTAGMSPKPKSVTVAGSFNGWNKDANPLKKNGDTWSLALPLPEGVHHYKFVLDGEKYIQDPKGDALFEEDDTFGGRNSGLLVGPDARKLPPAKPNAINPDGFRFDPKSAEDLNIVSEKELRLRVRVQKNDVQRVEVKIGSTEAELPKIATSPLGFDVYGGTIEVKDPTATFTLDFTDGTAETVLGASGPADAKTKIAVSPFTVEMKPTFVTPDWARDAVWYQIFPERFRNGDPSNDPTDGADTRLIKWTSKWWDTQPGEAPGAENFYEGQGNVWKRRYGGDVQGLKQAIPYLKKLGINAIYLNPVFEADSMHKYDATDFRHIDDNFGVRGDWPVAGETDDPATWQWSPSDKIFLDFVAAAHAEGMKVVIDGVFNHVGRPHPFFQDVLEKGKNSKYADWFEIVDWGDPANWKKMADPYAVHGKPGGIQWKAWDKLNGALPAFKKSAETGLTEGPANHIIAITKRWLAPDGDPSRGVDGWRLDAANEVPHPFWIKWREEVKKTKPDAYISGEIWSPAQPWINDGKQFDAVMNYQFAMPAQAFFVNQKKMIKPSEFLSRLTDVVYMYPQQASLVMMNLFDSHDTDRLASMFVNPDLNYDGANRLQDSGPKYSDRKPNEIERKRMMQAVACQMTYLGAPMIYYGDEAGMWSPDDPSNRQPMTWPEMKFEDPRVGFDQSIFDQFAKLIAIRKSLPALERGDFFPVSANDADGTLVYGRRHEGQTVYVAINRSAAKRTVKMNVDEAKWSDRVTGKQVAGVAGEATLNLEPFGYAIIAPE